MPKRVRRNAVLENRGTCRSGFVNADDEGAEDGAGGEEQLVRGSGGDGDYVAGGDDGGAAACDARAAGVAGGVTARADDAAAGDEGGASLLDHEDPIPVGLRFGRAAFAEDGELERGGSVVFESGTGAALLLRLGDVLSQLGAEIADGEDDSSGGGLRGQRQREGDAGC